MLQAYNPSFLVKESNNLFNHHQQMQQQLFKPDLNFVSAFNNGATASSPQYHSTYQSPSNTGNFFPPPHYDNSEQNQLQDPYVAAASQDSPTYNQYISTTSQKSYSTPVSSEEYSNLYKLNQVNGELSQQGYEYDYNTRQAENERILAQANQELLLQSQIQQQQQQQNEVSAHEQHQQYLAQQFGNKIPDNNGMRIYYPDEDSSNTPLQQRSDDYSFENYSTENFSSNENVQPTLSPSSSSPESNNAS